MQSLWLTKKFMPLLFILHKQLGVDYIILTIAEKHNKSHQEGRQRADHGTRKTPEYAL